LLHEVGRDALRDRSGVVVKSEGVVVGSEVAGVREGMAIVDVGRHVVQASVTRDYQQPFRICLGPK